MPTGYSREDKDRDKAHHIHVLLVPFVVADILVSQLPLLKKHKNLIKANKKKNSKALMTVHYLAIIMDSNL